MDPTPLAYAELKLAYDHFNARLFEGKLPACLITLQREKKTYGYFSSRRFGKRDGQVTDEIALNPEYFAIVPLIETLQTIVHEMVHLWQAHYGEPGRGRYHNSEWAERMESIGLMPSDTGRPGGKRTGDCMADYPLVGGPFVQAVDELVREHGFAISWFDLRAPPKVLYPPCPADVAGAVPAEALMVPSEQGLELLSSPSASVAAAPNRSNRLKYSCNKCKLNVWGKSGLRIACLNCSLELEISDVC